MVNIRAMHRDDAIKFFGSPAAVARALGITRAAVSKWPEVIPEGSAYKLEVVTGGKLRVKPELYPSSQTVSTAA